VEGGKEVGLDRAEIPIVEIPPLVRRVGRTLIGSLAGQLNLSGDWNSPETNAEIAADFGSCSGSAHLASADAL
jgi:hypothetical protein